MSGKVQRAGERDRYIEIQQLTETTAPGTGFAIEDWSALDHVWAAVDERGGRERFAEGQLTAPYDTRWQITYRPDCDPELVDVKKRRRLVFRGRSFDIVRAEVIASYTAIDLYTLAVVA